MLVFLTQRTVIENTNGDQNETSESSGDETDAVEAGINGD